MTRLIQSNDIVHWYMSEITSQIVAKSGIPTDRFHIGKIIWESLKSEPDFVMQIDGGTDESETNGSAFERSVRCAISFKNYGLKKGDVMVLMAPSHIDLAIPFYAALYLGIVIAAVDRNLTVMELRSYFNRIRPNFIFCQSEKGGDVRSVLKQLNIEAQVVIFDRNEGYCNFQEFIEKYGDDAAVQGFKPTDFNTEHTLAFLMPTSGTTGLPKAAAVTHKIFAISAPMLWSRCSTIPKPVQIALLCSPIDWLMAVVHFYLAPVLKYTRLQTSKPLTQEHAYYLINKYKPVATIMGPAFLATLLRPEERDKCDFTCLQLIIIAGSAFDPSLIKELKKVSPKTLAANGYGMTELLSGPFQGFPSPLGSCGKLKSHVLSRVVDVETQKDIIEPNKQGELWFKGPGIIKEYYNDPESTKLAFTEDGWFKTGDIFYIDDNWNFYFVERIKSLLKYKNHHISPVEIEGVIQKHPGVLNATVTSIKDPECDDLLVACVMRNYTYDVTAQEIKDLVKESLADFKQLRGGVAFLEELPQTSSGKINRKILREMVHNLKIE